VKRGYTPKYKEETGTIQAIDTDGNAQELTMVVQHVDIDPKIAKIVFDLGIEVGDWGWKHKKWIIPPDQLELVQAAARYYYGWKDGSERINHPPMGNLVYYEARYAC